MKIRNKYEQSANNLLWKESLNGDGHPFQQYQQNKHSHLILTELNEHQKDHDMWH